MAAVSYSNNASPSKASPVRIVPPEGVGTPRIKQEQDSLRNHKPNSPGGTVKVTIHNSSPGSSDSSVSSTPVTPKRRMNNGHPSQEKKHAAEVPASVPSPPAVATFLERNNRFTQSMFSRQVDVLRGQKASATTEVTNDKRQRDLELREEELNVVTEEALKQVEQVITLTRTIHERDDEIKKLRAENADLRTTNASLNKELTNREGEIKEMRLLNTELRAQLMQMRQAAAQHRTDAEKFKVENLVLTTATVNHNTAFEDTVVERDQLREIVEQQKRQLEDSQTEVTMLQSEAEELRAQVDELEESLAKTEVRQRRRSRAPGAGGSDEVEERTKVDLLGIIRRTIEEKVRWESYACWLVRRILDVGPEILECATEPGPASKHCCAVEARWEAYASRLLQLVMNKAPQLLTMMPTPNFTDHDKLAGVRMV